MGLRINTNANSVTALRNLLNTDKAQSKSIERLSTGLRINRASDDPSGLVISEQLRAQVGSLEQALENSEFASNLVGTADAALAETNDLLVDIRQSIIYALNTGGASADQIAAEQDAVDAALSSIDRIASTTRFGDTQLLNGDSAITTSSVDASIDNLNVQSVNLGDQSSRTYSAVISTAASRARVDMALTSGVASGDQVIRVTGSIGSADILISSGTTATGVVTAVNAVRSQTGVCAVIEVNSGTGELNQASLISEGFGDTETVTLAVVSGSDILAATTASGTVTGLASGSSLSTTGSDAVVTVAGAHVDVDGNAVTVNSSFLKAKFDIAANASGTKSFTVSESGLTFQLNSEAAATDRTTLGLINTSTSTLGMQSYSLGSGSAATTVGGFLSSLTAGNTNDLNSNADNALRIVDEAINSVTTLRGYLGAFEADTIESNANSLSIAIENLTASESEIRDLDFASEVAEFTRAQIMYSAGTSMLATANMIPQNVLTLLA